MRQRLTRAGREPTGPQHARWLQRRSGQTDTPRVTQRRNRPDREGPLTSEQAAKAYRSLRSALWMSAALAWVVAALAVAVVHQDRPLVAAVAAALAVLNTVGVWLTLRVIKKNIDGRVVPGALDRPNIGL